MSSQTDLDDPLVRNGAIAFARGDRTRAQETVSNIQRIAAQSADPDFARLARDVEAGNASIRQVFRHPEFHRISQQIVDNLRRGFARLPREQREMILERLHTRQAPASSSQPPATDAATPGDWERAPGTW
ncbi:hypothetical protein ACQP1U_01950 [Actinomycetota bacterium]